MESFQLPDRTGSASGSLVDVELHYRIACFVASVGHIDRHVERRPDLGFRRAQLQIVIGERRVAEPVSERIERRAQNVPVTRGESGSILWSLRECVVVVERQFTRAPGPTYGEMPGWIRVTKENVGDTVAGLASAIPCFDDCRNMLGSPGDIKRAPVNQNQHHWLASRRDCFQQFLLSAGELQI